MTPARWEPKSNQHDRPDPTRPDPATRTRDVRLRAALQEAAGWYRVGLLALRRAAVVGLLWDRGVGGSGGGDPGRVAVAGEATPRAG